MDPRSSSAPERSKWIAASLLWRSALFLLIAVFGCNVGGDTPPPPPGPSAFDGCSAFATAKVHPRLTCRALLGAKKVAAFGYSSEATGAVVIANGPGNQLVEHDGTATLDPARNWDGVGTPRPPASFQPGSHPMAVVVEYATSIDWTLGGETASSTDSAPECATRLDGGNLVLATDDGSAQFTLVTGSADSAVGDAIVPTQTVVSGNGDASAIGEVPAAFAVDFDGNATVSVPIAVPPGRLGMEPHLALSYSSASNANGIVGVGWSLSGFSEIARCEKSVFHDGTPSPVKFDGTDRYCLDGDPLVPVQTYVVKGSNGAPPPPEFRPQHDPYTRVVIDGFDELGPTSFTIWTRGGDIRSYGGAGAQLAGDRTSPVGDDGLAADAPAKARLAWMLAEVRDRFENSIRYLYEDTTPHPTGADSYLCSAMGACYPHELRPTDIDYTFGRDGAEARRSVHFVYDDTRKDREIYFTAGFPQWHRGRLSKIQTFGPMPTVTAAVREYRLRYHESDHTITGRSLLASISDCDANGACRPPRTFEYEHGSETFEHVSDLTGTSESHLQPAGPRILDGKIVNTGLVVADFDGDGRDDVLYQAGIDAHWWLRLSYGEGFAAPVASGLPIGPNGAIAQPIPVDWDADGKVDVAWPTLNKGPKATGYGYSIFKFDSTSSTFVEAGHVADNLNVAFFDANGDGQPEVAVVGGPNWWSVPGKGWPEFSSVSADLSIPEFTAEMNAVAAGFVFADPTPTGTGKYRWLDLLTGEANRIPIPSSGWAATFFDVNGDGLADVFGQEVGSSGFTLTLNTGNGFKQGGFGDPALTAFTWGPQDYRGVLPLDYRETGHPDTFAISSAGLAPTLIRFSVSPDTPAYEEHVLSPSSLPYFWSGGVAPSPFASQANVLDANGDGLEDLLLPAAIYNYPQLYIRRGKKADQLVSLGNGRGDTTSIEYKPLQFQAGGCSYPIRCGGRGMWIVTSYTAHAQDASIARKLDFAYGGPAIDISGGGSLGFSSRWTLDEQTHEEVTTTFGLRDTKALGAYPYVHVPTEIVRKTPVGASTITATQTFEYTLGHENVVPFVPGAQHAVAVLPTLQGQQVVETRLDGTSTELRDLQTSFSNYDAYGNARTVITTAKLAGVTTTTHTQYHNDEGPWLLGLPTRVEQTSDVGLISLLDPTGGRQTRVTTFAYDDVTGAELLRTIEPDGDSTTKLLRTVTRNALGVVTGVQWSDSSGRTKSWSYALDDEGIFPTAAIDPLGHVQRQRVHPSLGVVAWTKGANGVVQRAQYDGFGALRHTFSPECEGSCPTLLAETTITHEAAPTAGASFAVRATTSGGGTTVSTFDALGRTILSQSTAFDGATAQSALAYDPIFTTNVATEVRLVGGKAGDASITSSYRYDAAGRLVSATMPATGTTKFAYDGLKSTRTDALGHRSYVVRDELARIVRSVDVNENLVRPGGLGRPAVVDTVEATTNYIWGPFEQLLEIIDAGKNATQIYYDRRGRRVLLDDPDSGKTLTDYNAFNEPYRSVDAEGRETLLVFDDLGRAVAKKTPDGTSCFSFDPTPAATGQLGTATYLPTEGDAVTTTMSYDGFGRSTSTSQQIGSSSPLVTSSIYDDFGRIGTLTYPNGVAVQYDYDPGGYLKKISRLGATPDVPPSPLWTLDKQNLLGQSELETFGNGQRTFRNYYAKSSLPKSIATIATFGPIATIAQNASYKWFADGNVESRTDAADAAHPATEHFDYDGLERVTNWAGNTWNVSFAYDTIGNLLSRDALRPDGSHETEAFTPGAPGAPQPHAVHTSSAGAYEYDATGNQKAAPGRTADWTSFHLPKRVQSGDVTAAYEYDALQHRVRRRLGDETTTYFGPFERRESGATTTEVISVSNGGRVIAQVVRKQLAGVDAGEDTYFLHDDRLGSAEAITGTLGLVVEKRHYEPFGRRVQVNDGTAPAGVSDSDVRLGFTGHEAEEAIGLVNMEGRIYDPKTARFLSPDPVVQAPYVGQNLNRYSYALNNPIRYVDPTGFTGEEASSDSSDVPPTFSPVPPIPTGWGSGSGGGGGSSLPTIGAGFRIPFAPPPAPPPAGQLILPADASGTARRVDVGGAHAAAAFHAISFPLIPRLGMAYSWAGPPGTPGPDLIGGPGTHNWHMQLQASSMAGAEFVGSSVLRAFAMYGMISGAGAALRGGIVLWNALLAGDAALGTAWFAGETTFVGELGAAGMRFMDTLLGTEDGALGISISDANWSGGGGGGFIGGGGWGSGGRGPRATLELAEIIQGRTPLSAKTIALLETLEGPTLVGGGESDLTAAQIALAREYGLVPTALEGMHAEQTVLHESVQMGYTPLRGVSTNPPCPLRCAPLIKEWGGTIEGHYWNFDSNF